MLGYRDLHKRPGQVVLIAARSDEGGRAQTLAHDLALALKSSVLTLSLPSEDGENETTEAQLLSQLSRVNAATVVVDLAASPFRTEDQLRQALDAARCPIVVLGSEQNPVGDEPATVKPALEKEPVEPEESE